MPKLKILMVNLGFLPESVGGSEVYTYQLSKALMEKGHEVTVLVALDDVRLERYKVVRSTFEDIRVIKIVNSSIYARSFVDYFQNRQIDKLFEKIVREAKPDLIHFQHLAYLSAALPEIAHQMKVPSILTLHDYWYMCFRSQLLRPGYGICPGPSEGAFCASCNHKSAPNPMAVPRFPLLVKAMNSPEIKRRLAAIIARFPASVVSQARAWLFKERSNGAGFSESTSLAENKFRYQLFKTQFLFPAFVLSPSFYLKQRYESEGFREITVLPLGLNATDKVKKLPFNGKLRIGYLGNIERHKGLLLMLKELGKIRELDNIVIDIYGKPKDPVYYAEVKKLAKRSLGEKVAFHGTYRSGADLKAILASVHLMVFPSLWEENYPLVIREALLQGIPVVASKIGGVSEVIKDGVNGLLFDPYEEGALAARISSILDDPQILESITEGARGTRIESMEDHVVKVCALYQLALEKRGSPESASSDAALVREI